MVLQDGVPQPSPLNYVHLLLLISSPSPDSIVPLAPSATQFVVIVTRSLVPNRYPVFDFIPHTLGITAQAYELPHK